MADLVYKEVGHSCPAPGTRFKKISKLNIAHMLGRGSSWVLECVEAQKLIDRKKDANETIKQYLDEAIEDPSPFRAKSFLDYLKTL